VAHVYGRELSPTEIDLHHRKLSLQVELVTIQQRAALRCLEARHGLERVWCEGATSASLPGFQDAMDSLGQTAQDLHRLQKSRAGLKGNAEAIDRKIAELVGGHRQQLLPFGVAGVLAVEQLADVLHLDDKQKPEATKPLRPDGSVRLDPENHEARHDGQVQEMRKSTDPVALIMLGASHDLSEAIARHGGRRSRSGSPPPRSSDSPGRMCHELPLLLRRQLLPSVDPLRPLAQLLLALPLPGGRFSKWSWVQLAASVC
jgi:hypothetical protein